MDCYSAESEFIESLDFLSPPVKRVHHSRETFGSVFHNEPSNVHLLRGLRNKFARRSPSSTRNTRTVKTNADSSTSLILKKTSERQILEHYSIVSYTSLHQPGDDNISNRKIEKNDHEKPLIKVTVIPRSDQVNATKILRKRRYIPKKIQSTTSNHENSVQTKNVYLIVAGRRREKIYEIKTTGSAQFSTDHDSFSKDEEIPMKELTSFKHLLQTLNMDKKKKKAKSVISSHEKKKSSILMQGATGYPTCQDCMCAESKHEEVTTPPKSHLRIFGKFGISQDDKYVLRYGASVDDKEVLSDVAQLTRDFSPIIIPQSSSGAAYIEDQEPQIDSGVQAEINEENKLLNFEVIAAADTVPSKESQGTQVNFSVQFAKGAVRKYSDKKIQCSDGVTANKQSDNKALRDVQSPLVIISVYPKQSPDDPFKGISQQSSPTMRCLSPARMNNSYNMSNQLLKTDKSPKRNNLETRRNSKPAARSRSPSPPKKGSRMKLFEEKLIESRFNKTPVTERRSPDRQKALRAIKDKILEKDKISHDVNTRKSLKHIMSNATQVANNAQNITVSNATQVSRKIPQNITSSYGTQATLPHRRNLASSNATQNTRSPQKFQNSSGVQAFNSSRNLISPVAISKASQMSDSVQVSTRNQQNNGTNNATQVSSRNDRLKKISNATQVSKDQQLFIASRLSKNQGTYTVPNALNDSHIMTNESVVAKDMGTNTEHARAKKALVETYTKQLTQQMNQQEFIPTKFDNSKVTINIDGDKEYYDVLLKQNKLSTDLMVRKTMKDMASQKSWEEECSASLENYLFMPESTETRTECVLPGMKCRTKFFSQGLYDSRSGDESPIINQHVSRITIRDSLEISHRREDKSNHNNMKNTQTCFTAQFTDNIPDETAFLAPIKHYTGDDCSLSNPIERDKQIRELLGVDRIRPGYYKAQALDSEKDDDFPYQCIYRQECEKSQVTEINFEFHKLHKFCPCLKTINRNSGKPGQSVSVQCQRTACCNRPNYHSNYNDPGNKRHFGLAHSNANYASKQQYDRCFPRGINADYSKASVGKCCSKENQSKNAAIYQQLILNRNIQVFLQVEQFSKQKPIILSRKQYDKVKKTIQKTISKKKSSHDKKKNSKFICKQCDRSEVYVGEIRKRMGKDSNCLSNKEVQTDLVPCTEESCRKAKLKHQSPESSEDSDDQNIGNVSGKPRKFVVRPCGAAEKSKDRSKCHGRKKVKEVVGSKAKPNTEKCAIDQKLKKDQTPTIYQKQKMEAKRISGDQSSSGDKLWYSNQSVKLLKEMSDEPIVERVGEQTRARGDRNGERKNKRKVEGNTARFKENKMDHGEERHKEHIRERNLERQSELTEPHSQHHKDFGPERHTKLKETSPGRSSKQREQIRPGRFTQRALSPGRASEREPSSGRSSKRKEESSPDCYERKTADFIIDRYSEKNKHNTPDRYSEEIISPETDSEQIDEHSLEFSDPNQDNNKNRNETEIKTLILFNAEDSKASKNGKETEKDSPTRRTMSSLEIRYASVAFMKQAAYSSTDVGALSNSSLGHVNSFHTIFRGHRKSPTPNLGTSAYSLYSEGLHSDKSAAFIMINRDSKQPAKKPFLRRLMSCLVMRSTRDSELKIPIGPAPELPSVNSSIDSYHISTTLGAIEVSSSIYDTSASFYSNHTILPVNSKIKRGFFSSVRGFLTNRKS